MDLEKDCFCTTCDTSYTILHSPKKGELHEEPEFCPFCGELVEQIEDLENE